MTEKEKMQRQMLYDANYDSQLLEERKVAKDLCYEYNRLRPSDEEAQQALMRRLLGKTKGNFCIIAPFWCDYGYNIEVGENFFANPILLYWMVPRCALVIMFLWLQVVGFILLVILLMLSEGIKDWNMHIQSQ